MNLNPLFFNKIAKDSTPFNSNPSGGAGQSYLFADIINITTEELPDVNQLQKSDAVNLVLPGISNINIEIPVNEELLAELKQIITDSTPKIENINREVYNLEDANITKTDNLINEDTLLAFIAGLNQIIKPDVNKLGLLNNTNPDQPEVEYNYESPEDSLKDVLTLETIQNVLDNNHSIKFTLRSLSEKITIQISAEDDNNIVNAEQALKNISDYSKNVIAEAVTKQNIEITEPIVSVGDTENEVIKESKLEPEINLESKPDTEELLPVNNKEISSEVNSDKANNDSTKFKVEIVHSEINSNANRFPSGIKIPFILDIKTSREIGEFLSKYNFENTSSVDQAETIDNQAQDTTTQNMPENTSGTTEINEEPRQSKLVFIKGSELLDSEKDLNLSELKRTSSEFLRAIKIENPEKIAKVNVIENNYNIEEVKGSEKSLEAITANSISEQETAIINDNSSDNIQNLSDNKKEFVVTDQQKPEVETTNSIKKEVAVNKTEENVVITSKSPQVEPTSKESESTLTSQSKVENVSVTDKPATGSNNFNKDEKDAKQEDQITEVKSKSEKIKNENKNSEEDTHQLKTAKDQVKHTDVNNHPVFEKKAVEVTELSNKILSTANSFKETVKKVKSTEILSEISKYLNTNEKQSITFHLTPKNLGTVKLTVDYVENALQATIEVENEQIRQTVQSNIEQLKTTLQNSGIQLSNLNVNLSNGEPKTHKQFASKKKGYNTNNEPKVEQQGELTGKKKLGYNTYEYLV